MTQPQTTNRWSVVIGAILIQFCLGSIYAWGVFAAKLKTLPAPANWTNAQTQMVFSLELIIFALVMLYAGKLLTKVHPRLLVLASGTLVGLGYVIAGVLGGKDLMTVTLAIGIITGTGLGLGYVVPIAVCIRWFPDMKGLITGLAVAGFGLGAICWGKMAGTWGNMLATYDIGGTFLIYGVVFIVVVALGSLLMKFPPEGWVPEGYVPPVATAGVASSSGAADFTIPEMLGTAQFFLIFIVFTVSSAAGLACIGLIISYSNQELTQAFSATITDIAAAKSAAKAAAEMAMLVVFPVCNSLGRIGWGTASDKLGRKTSILLMIAIQGAVILTFPMIVANPLLLAVYAGIIGFNFGGNFALFPTMTADTFGTKRVGQNYPVVFLAYGVGGVAGPLLAGYAGDLKQFPLAFTIGGIALLISAVLIFLVKPATKPVAVEAAA